MTRDVELRYTASQLPVATFTLAVDRDFGAKGERATDFIDVVAWRQTAEFVNKYFKKGDMAAVTGRLQIRGWEDKDGQKRKSAEVIAEHIYFAGAKTYIDEAKTPTKAGIAVQFEDVEEGLPF